MKHITVAGVPWCEVCSRYMSSELFRALFKEGDEKRMLLICTNSYPSDDAAVELLRKHGINAQLTEGNCPTLD